MTPMLDAPADLWRMSATELAEAIRSKQVSSREVIEAHLRRIEAVDPEVNAVPVVLGEQALQAADRRSRRVLASSPPSTRARRQPPGMTGANRHRLRAGGTPLKLGRSPR